MTPARFRDLVSGVLIVGVGASAVLILIGLVGSTILGWDGSLAGQAPSATTATDFAGVFTGLGALRPIAFAQLGLLVLIATPVVRVATSVVAFATERDWLYTAITLVVLGILLVSLFAIR